MKKLTAKHLKAIELMVYTEMTNIQIAKEIGCNNNSISNWFKDDLFMSELQAETRRKFQRMATKATKKIEKLIDTENETVALKASVEILNKAGYKEVEKVENTNTNITVSVED